MSLPFFKKYIIRTAYSNKQIRDILNLNITSKKHESLSFNNEFFGTVGENSFKISKAFLFSDTPLVEIAGEFRNDNAGSIVEISFKLPISPAFFLILSLAFILFFTIISFIYADGMLLKLMPLVMIIPVGIIIILPYLLAVRSCKVKLQELFRYR